MTHNKARQVATLDSLWRLVGLLLGDERHAVLGLHLAAHRLQANEALRSGDVLHLDGILREMKHVLANRLVVGALLQHKSSGSKT